MKKKISLVLALAMILTTGLPLTAIAAPTGIRVFIGESVSCAKEKTVLLEKLFIRAEAKNTYEGGAVFTITLSEGFAFTNTEPKGHGFRPGSWEARDGKATFKADAKDEYILLKDIEIEATSADLGEAVTLFVTAEGVASVVVDGEEPTNPVAEEDGGKVAEKEEADTLHLKLPIGAPTMVVNGEESRLDAPAYINAEGYTMLPVRAVAKAFGLDDKDVAWDGVTKTVTITKGGDSIVMTVDERYISINGKREAASSKVEISDSRAFLPVRDLAAALGGLTMTWDKNTQIVTLESADGGVTV